MPVPYDPERHEPLIGEPWDAGLAHDAIRDIAGTTRSAASRVGTWPLHPLDGPEGTPQMLGLYTGSAGVIWALDVLDRSGHATGETFAEHLPRHVAWNLASHLELGLQTRSYLLAQAGLLLALHRTAPSAATADALATAIADNSEDATLELMWGAPGTMIAALFMHRATGEPRWAELFRTGASALERTFQSDPAIGGAHVWTQALYGQQLKHYGLVHGFAGNAFTLLAGRDLLATEDWARWSPRLAETLAATPIREGDLANWLAGEGPPRPGRAKMVQICHGAPGMVVGLSALDQPIDELLIAGGELTWTAGPTTKGPGLCHGTAGNGYAFLKLYKRTRDPLWLDRARAFAMHAVAQWRARAGGPRHTLWTGDLGLALYLVDCIEGEARFPTLDAD